MTEAQSSEVDEKLHQTVLDYQGLSLVTIFRYTGIRSFEKLVSEPIYEKK
jgi:hypothetical protein